MGTAAAVVAAAEKSAHELRVTIQLAQCRRLSRLKGKYPPNMETLQNLDQLILI